MASSNPFERFRPRLPLSLAVLLSLAPLPGAHLAPRRAASVRVAGLRTEYQVDPLGIDVRQPRLSWQLDSPARGIVQSAYEVQVSADSAALNRGRSLLWDSGRISSDSSVQVGYAGPALRSQTRYFWRVRAWDGAGRATAWSTPAWWETGVLQPSEWRARWIETTWPEVDSISNPGALLRRDFSVRGPVRSARLYVTSHGLYEAYIDGHRVGDAVLTPGWTSYNHQLQYQTYDVTSLLHAGANAIGAMLGDGWYRGRIGFSHQRNFYGDKLGLLAQLRIDYADGSHEVVTTDGSWKATPGPIRADNIYDGEDYDARLAPRGWSSPGFDDRAWQPVRAAGGADSTLVAPTAPPMRRMAEVHPIAIIHTPDGHIVFDMGQNMVGWVRLRVNGPEGTTVTLKHAEMLDQKGNLYTENLRSAKATDHYTLRGGGEEVFEPHFTFHGFRYVQVEGYPGTPTLADVTGIVVHSALDQTGHFDTSNPLLNQLQHNITWGQWGNFLDVPTDCPQRDERLGWTGDAEVFSPTAAFNMGVAGFFTKWLRDMAADQDTSGAVPFVIPNVLGRTEGAAGWSDADVIIPWNMYLAYGDRRILEQQYPSMKAWVDHVDRRAGPSHLWSRDFQFGDWLAYATTRSDYPGATTGKDLVATAYFAHSADLLSRMAGVLGHTADERHYRELATEIRDAFQREFITATGRVGENTQTAYVLALSFDLVPDSLRASAAQRLADDVRSHGNHLTTGFLGTPELTEELTRYGHLDVAYALLNQDTYPSWLYPVKHGATTIWERWDGVKPDGSFQDPGMNSFNHYAYGAIGDWMYRTVAGLDLDPAHPGYKHALIHPQPGGGLTHATASLATQYGLLGSSWTIRDGRMAMEVDVPGNTTATVRLPGATLATVTESGRALGSAEGIRSARQESGAVVAEVGSGHYRFEYPYASAVQASRTASAGTSARVPDRLVVLTFDDAVKSDYTTVAPLLKKYGFGATFFVTEFVKPPFADTTLYMTWPQMRVLNDMGFEIGNHTWNHAHVDRLDSARVVAQLDTIEARCRRYGIPRPVSFAYPAYVHGPGALAALRAHGYRFARIGDSRAYDPARDDPLLIPSFSTSGDDSAKVLRALDEARDGHVVVLTVHGVPDAAHPWVSTPPALFERYLRYLHDHRYTVIAMRDLAKYIPPQVAAVHVAVQEAGEVATALDTVATGSLRPMPSEWVDSATGHRVVRLSDPSVSSTSFYFTNDPFVHTAAGERMVYYGGTPDGRQLFAIDLATHAITQLTRHPGGVTGEIVARHHREAIFQARDSIFAVDVVTGATRLLHVLPPDVRGSVTTLNADETMLAGVVAGSQAREILAKYPAKGQFFTRIFAAHIPHALFTINLRTGTLRRIHEENTWLGHVQFSPTDPDLLMFCHEGPWQLVDRIWTIDVRTGRVRLMHKRTVPNEIAGHESWSADGSTIWYDLQIPRSVTFYLAGVNVRTGARTRFGLGRDEWSIHFASAPHAAVFAGDGGDSSQVARAKHGQWLYLFRPRGDSLAAERLVDMRRHVYHLEPNVHFTPDGKWIVFRGNFEGRPQIYEVEIAKS